MSDSPEQRPIDKRQQLRRQGWILCLEGLGIAAIVSVIALGWGWFANSYKVAYGVLGFGLFVLISGLVKVVRSWSSSSPTDRPDE